MFHTQQVTPSGADQARWRWVSDLGPFNIPSLSLLPKVTACYFRQNPLSPELGYSHHHNVVRYSAVLCYRFVVHRIFLNDRDSGSQLGCLASRLPLSGLGRYGSDSHPQLPGEWPTRFIGTVAGFTRLRREMILVAVRPGYKLQPYVLTLATSGWFLFRTPQPSFL